MGRSYQSLNVYQAIKYVQQHHGIAAHLDTRSNFCPLSSVILINIIYPFVDHISFPLETLAYNQEPPESFWNNVIFLANSQGGNVAMMTMMMMTTGWLQVWHLHHPCSIPSTRRYRLLGQTRIDRDETMMMMIFLVCFCCMHLPQQKKKLRQHKCLKCLRVFILIYKRLQ